MIRTHMQATKAAALREELVSPKRLREARTYQRDRKVNREVVDRWVNDFPEIALLARGQAVAMGAAARRERLASKYPAFLCGRCGSEERPADYVDPGQAADAARVGLCWACVTAEWLAPIAEHPAAEVRDGVVWLGGVAIGLRPAQASPDEEEDDGDEEAVGHQGFPLRR